MKGFEWDFPINNMDMLTDFIDQIGHIV